MNKGKLIRIIMSVILVAGIALAIVYRDQFNEEQIKSWFDQLGVFAPILFMAVYAIATVFFLPGSIITLAGGALFGPVWGTFYNLTGATIGATLAFLVSRYLASDWVKEKTGGKLKRIIEGVESEGWRFVAFTRLVPLFPFNVLNYALGLTRIKLSHYILTSYICMIPGGFAYTYLGYAGREAATGGEGMIQKGLLALALVAVVAFLPRLVGKLRQKPMISIPELKQRLDNKEDLLVLDVRTAKEFAGELKHIAGAINIPIKELSKQLDRLESYQEHPVVIVCHTDKRSSKASRLLARKGFVDVHVAKGGMTDWNRNGYPVE